MAKIRILAIPSDAHGVGKYRIINPYSHLQEKYPDDFHIDIKFDVADKDEEFNNYDIVVAHSVIHKDSAYENNIQRVQWLKKKGIIVVIDADDYWSPDFRHPMYQYIKQEEIDKKKVVLLQSASYVTTTTPFFRDTLMKKLSIKNVLVFPNAIDETEPQFIPKPTESDKIRFGWLGGSSHLHDIELIQSGINVTQDYAKDKVQFVLCGFDLRGFINEINKQTKEVKKRPIKPEETVWYQYEKIFTHDYKVLDAEYVKFLKLFVESDYNDIDKPYRRRWTKEISKYALNYNTFDVSLAPLVDTMFNNNKSQLKAIEAGFHKKALIASECMPYTLDLIGTTTKGGQTNPKGNALLVSPSKNHKQWAQHMKRLIDNPNMIEDLGNKLYETVRVAYSLNKVSQDRAQFFKSLINN